MQARQEMASGGRRGPRLYCGLSRPTLTRVSSPAVRPRRPGSFLAGAGCGLLGLPGRSLLPGGSCRSAIAPAIARCVSADGRLRAEKNHFLSLAAFRPQCTSAVITLRLRSAGLHSAPRITASRRSGLSRPRSARAAVRASLPRSPSPCPLCGASARWGPAAPSACAPHVAHGRVRLLR